MIYQSYTLVVALFSCHALASQRVPTIRNVGRFKGHGHEISSGEVTILNSRQILIRNFTYAGTAPGAYFYIGETAEIEVQRSRHYGKIPDETGNKITPLREYRGEDLVLTLPGDLCFNHNPDWLAVWCVPLGVNLGEVRFPRALNIVPNLQKCERSLRKGVYYY